MSDFQRRDFLKGTAAFAAGVTAALAGARRAEAGDPSFMNNVPDPLLSGKELPTFKFALEKSKAKVIGKNTAREATRRAVADLQGDRRRVHGARTGGHARAALARHRGRVGLRGQGAGPDDGPRPGGYRETNDFEPGDVWYFPRGHGHMLECLGDEPCHFVLIFDNGYFSEFGTFSITRLDRPHPQGAAGEELRPPRIDLRRLPEEGGVLRPGDAAAREAGRPARGGGSRRRGRTSIGSSPISPASTTRAAGCGWSIPRSFRSPRP